MSSPGSSENDTRAPSYECPADFVPLEYSSRKKSKFERTGNTELWLIKAPASFNPSSLAGLKVSLSGLETIQSNDASHIYNVLSSRLGPTDLYFLNSSGNKQSAAPCASGFAGILSISESYGDCSENQNLLPVPAVHAPGIPPGLKQRFHPFGSSTAAHAFQNHSSTSLLPLKKVKLESEETKDQSKKRKKKKKDKHSREEMTEVAHIKQENTSQECDELQVPELVEEGNTTERKKRKIKNEKERKNAQDEVAIDESLIVKQEPMDTSSGDVENSVKKKKKKKKKTQDE